MIGSDKKESGYKEGGLNERREYNEEESASLNEAEKLLVKFHIFLKAS